MTLVYVAASASQPLAQLVKNSTPTFAAVPVSLKNLLATASAILTPMTANASVCHKSAR